MTNANTTIETNRTANGDVMGSCPDCGRTWHMEPRRDSEPFVERAEKDIRQRVESHMPCNSEQSGD